MVSALSLHLWLLVRCADRRSLTSTYTLPKLQNCGFLTGIIGIFMSGKGNTIDLDLEILESL